MPKKRKSKTGAPDDISLSFSIECSDVDVEVNPAVYSEEDAQRIKGIVDHMKDHIYLDRTYVVYKGTRWNDAFIVEERWHKFCKLIVDTHFGNDAGKKINDFILGILETLAEMYLYQVISLYGYDPEFVELTFPEECEISADYEIDDRKEWNS